LLGWRRGRRRDTARIDDDAAWHAAWVALLVVHGLARARVNAPPLVIYVHHSVSRATEEPKHEGNADVRSEETHD